MTTPFFSDAKPAAEALEAGNNDPLKKYLAEIYYSTESLACYFSENFSDPNFTEEQLAPSILDARAQRVVREYHALVDEREMDDFVHALEGFSNNQKSGRRNVGAHSGEYFRYSELFDEDIEKLLEPDTYFYKKLLEMKKRPDANFPARPRNSWHLNWDYPVKCKGFSLRVAAKPALPVMRNFSLPISMNSFHARYFLDKQASLAVPFTANSEVKFSVILWMGDTKDVENFQVFCNDVEIDFDFKCLNNHFVFLYGTLANHTQLSVWRMCLGPEVASPVTWLLDFCLHEFSR